MKIAYAPQRAKEATQLKEFLALPGRSKRRRISKIQPIAGNPLALQRTSLRASSRKVAEHPIRARHAEAKQRRAAAAALSRIKLIDLLPECAELEFVIRQGCSNVLALSQASTGKMRAVPGLGPVRRKKVRDYLIGKSVEVAWEA